ncbi:MAG: hypothetical protein ACK4P1_11390, partial [Aggregatilineales bacterium]
FGVSGHMVYSFSRELEGHKWSLLRLTPHHSAVLALAKALAIGRAWYGVLKVLFALRAFALLVLPIAFAAQRSRELGALSSLDFLGAAIFLAQPFAEAFMVATVSLLIAIQLRQARWARLYAYGALILSIGALNGVFSLWLTFNAPMGALATLMLPIGHWLPLVATAFPPQGAALHATQTLVLALSAVVLPLSVGGAALGVSLWRLGRLV